MTDICLHIGLGKTATTYLQKSVFSKYSALGRDSNILGADKIEHQLSSIICRDRPSVWNTAKGQKIANQINNLSNINPIIYSTEYWASPPFWNSDAVFQTYHVNKLIFVEHLNYFARFAWKDKGMVSAVLVVRNQPDWLASYYVQRSSRFSGSQEHFERSVRNLLKIDNYAGAWFLEYDRLLSNMISGLGQGRVMILLYEELNSQVFWDDLSKIVGYIIHSENNKINKKYNVGRYSDNVWRLRTEKVVTRRFIKKNVLDDPKIGSSIVRKIGLNIFTRFDRIISKQSRKYIYMPDQLREEIQHRFMKSNRRLSQILGRDIHSFGYY